MSTLKVNDIEEATTNGAKVFFTRCWVDYAPQSNSINASGALSSIADNATGDQTFNFSNANSSAYYSYGGCGYDDSLGNADDGIWGNQIEPIAEENEFDIIHAHDWLAYPAGIAAKEVSGKPLIIHVHATDFDRSGGNVNPDVYHIEKAGNLLKKIKHDPGLQFWPAYLKGLISLRLNRNSEAKFAFRAAADHLGLISTKTYFQTISTHT